MDGMEEMELSAPEQQGQDIVMGSPEKEDTCTETNLAQHGEPKMHQTGAYLSAAQCSQCGHV